MEFEYLEDTNSASAATTMVTVSKPQAHGDFIISPSVEERNKNKVPRLRDLSLRALQVDIDVDDVQQEAGVFKPDDMTGHMISGEPQYILNTLDCPMPVCTQTMVNRVDVPDINSQSDITCQYTAAPSFLDLQLPPDTPAYNMQRFQQLPQTEFQTTNTPVSSFQTTSTPVSAFRVVKPTPHTGPNRYFYTPHPNTGQLIYVGGGDGASPQFYHKLTPSRSLTLRDSDAHVQFITPRQLNVTSNSTLNSSGEDAVCSPVEPSDNSGSTQESSYESRDEKLAHLLAPSFELQEDCEETREQHNLKERRRRARIKDACDVMRKLVPGMCDKTDKATVFEFAARYIHYLKGFTKTQYDKDFLLKYSPY